MRKFLAAVGISAMLASSASAVSIGNFIVSPEIGVGYGNSKLKVGSESASLDNLSAYARVWLGAFNFVVAPQYKLDWISLDKDKPYNPDEKNHIINRQYGLSVGYLLPIPVVDIIPYVGANRSTFEKVNYESTIAYNYGIMAKVALLPISIGVHGSYQKPEVKAGNGVARKDKLSSIQFTLGLAF